MRRKWLILPIAAFWILMANRPLIAEPGISERVTNYSVEYLDWKWYHKFIVYLAGYEFLSWNDVELKENLLENPETGKKEIVELSLSPKSGKKILYLKNGGAETTGTASLRTEEEFKNEEAAKLLAMMNYLYDCSQNQDFEIESSELFISKKGSMHCRLKKEKSGNQDIIIVKTFTKSKQSSQIEIVLSLPAHAYRQAGGEQVPEIPIIEKMTAELHSGQKIIFTKKPSI